MISENLKKRTYTSVTLILILFLMLLVKPILLYFLIIIGIFSIIEFSDLIKTINKKFIFKIFYNLIFILFIFIFCLFFFIFSNIIQFKIILFSLLLTCISSDIGGYIFGKTFKGPKITKISPNKTISGSIGSFAFSLMLIPFFLNFIYIESIFNLVLITILISLTSQIGDLFISYLKRKAKVKDTSDLLPGHGGLLDRIDGIIFSIPMGLLLFNIF